MNEQRASVTNDVIVPDLRLRSGDDNLRVDGPAACRHVRVFGEEGPNAGRLSVHRVLHRGGVVG